MQGATLPLVIRRLGLPPPDPYEDARQAAEAQREAVSAAGRRLDSLLEGHEEEPPPEVVNRLREHLKYRSAAAFEREDLRYGKSPVAQSRRLRRAMLQAEREVFVRMRDEGRLEDEVLRRLQGALDLEEMLLREERPPEPERGRGQ